MKTPPQDIVNIKTAIDPELIEQLKARLPLYKSQAEMARRVGISASQISRALRPEDGAFPYNIEEFESRARQWLATVSYVRAVDHDLCTDGFLVQPMDDFLTTVMLTRDIGVAWSPAGHGKTDGIEVFRQRNASSIVVTARKGLCGWRAIRDAILKALPNKRRMKNTDGHRESWDEFILRTFSGSGRLLIIDNAHLLTESSRQWLAYDWHEETGCPLALVGNPAIKDQWSRNDQHQSRVGLARAVTPAEGVTAASTASQMLKLFLPEAAADRETIKLATAVLKSNGACRALRKHLLLTKELLSSTHYSSSAPAFKAAHSQLLHSPDLNLEAA